VRPVGSSLATWAELNPTPKKNRERDLWFFGVFILRSVFLYYKNTNLVLKYLVFYEMLQKYIYMKKLKKKKDFVFMHTTKSLKDKKKIIS
jgi:hypothetical protein